MDARDGEFTVPAGRPDERLDRVVRAFRPGLSWAKVRDLVARGFVLVDGSVVRDAGSEVRSGQNVRIAVGHREPRSAQGPVVPALPREALVHVDRDVAVVDKPSGLPTVPYEGENEPTLDRLVQEALGGPVHVVQRLDRDTSGLLVFARNRDAEQALAQQLRFHTMHRRYLALVHGEPRSETIRSFLAEDRGDGLRGSTRNERLGKLAVTHVEVVERLGGATLVACRLETGRTHQIRIHLAEAGHMLLGERAYVREHEGPVLPAPRICLHAMELGFEHPRDRRRLQFVRELPADLATVVQGLRPG